MARNAPRTGQSAPNKTFSSSPESSQTQCQDAAEVSGTGQEGAWRRGQDAPRGLGPALTFPAFPTGPPGSPPGSSFPSGASRSWAGWESRVRPGCLGAPCLSLCTGRGAMPKASRLSCGAVVCLHLAMASGRARSPKPKPEDQLWQTSKQGALLSGAPFSPERMQKGLTAHRRCRSRLRQRKERRRAPRAASATARIAGTRSLTFFR